jgi:hypothetical protein
VLFFLTACSFPLAADLWFPGLSPAIPGQHGGIVHHNSRGMGRDVRVGAGVASSTVDSLEQ